MILQKPEDDSLPIGMVDRSDVTNPGGHPELVGSRVGVDDTPDDRLGHSLIVSIHDREERCPDA